MTHLIGGISSAGRALPLSDGRGFLVSSAKGPYVFDEDGRRYIDTAMGFRATFLGHTHPQVVEAVQAAVGRGSMPAYAHAREGEAAAALAAHTGALSQVVFVNSGSEAVHLACRAAKAATGRRVVAKLAAGYDGWFADMAFGNAATAESRMRANARPRQGDTVLTRFNDLSDAASLFFEEPDLAAVIVEPVMANAGCIEPDPAYLRRLADMAREAGAMVIADEVLMGYLITRGEAPSLANPELLALALAGLASILAFILVETRNPRPMFDFRTFRDRSFSGALLGAAGMNFSFWPFVIYLPIYFQVVQGLDSLRMGLVLLAYTLPTLVMPPLAERLLLARGARFVIPLGLFAISLGFVLMRLGADFSGNGWLAMLPGCVVAGVGLGLTNTPVTNTATASVPTERAGMASGMDMSARMISLAINIALMGLILLHGIRASLEHLAPDVTAAIALLSEAIAAGNLAAAASGGISGEIARQALAEGFAAVMLYGAVAAFGLGLLSRLTLQGRRASLA